MLLPLLSDWIRQDGKYTDQDGFFPCPKITFLVDQPLNLECKLCHVTNLTFRSDTLGISDRTPAILPCGHLAGFRCLKKYIEAKNDCPFCRMPLVYEGCGHKIPPRPVTRESVHLLPRTLPDGGKVPHICRDCAKPGLRSMAYKRYKEAKEEFASAKTTYFQTQSKADGVVLIAKKRELETAMLEHLHLKGMLTLLCNW
jgi:hypothetical protein